MWILSPRLLQDQDEYLVGALLLARMDKGTAKKGKKDTSIPNKVLHSRVSYLYQAASYLATHDPKDLSTSTATSQVAESEQMKSKKPAEQLPEIQLHSVARRMVSDLRTVSQKVQIRLSPAMKHSFCKKCDTILVEGSTCVNRIENKSKGGRKPWADILVRKCNCCGCEKRFPLAAGRQRRRPHRSSQAPASG